MDNLIVRVSHDLVARLDGPLHLRFILQPAMSIFFAIRDGIHDARQHQSPYLWTLCTDRSQRRDLLVRGWASVGKICLMAIVLDTVYQIAARRNFYPGEALLAAFLLALFPYAVVRGPVNRTVRYWREVRRGRAVKRRYV